MGKKTFDKKPKFAAGDDQTLERSATDEEIKKGKFTKVTQLSFDEVSPS